MLNISTSVFIADTDFTNKNSQNDFKDIFDGIAVDAEYGVVKAIFKGDVKGSSKKDILDTSKGPPKSKSFRNQIGFYTRMRRTTKNLMFTRFDKLLNPKKLDIHKSFFNSNCKYDEANIFRTGKSMIQFNSIRLNLNKTASASHSVRLFTSVPRKAHMNYIHDIEYTLTPKDIENEYVTFQFPSTFADGIYIVDDDNCIDFNQPEVELIIESNIMLFSTGKLKIAGTISSDAAKRAIEILISKLDHTFALQSLETIMINSDFCVDFELNCKKLFDILQNSYIISYQPNVHPAVIVKYETCSILVFSSGKIILTGSRFIEKIKNVHLKFNTILNENRKLIEL